MGRTNTFQVYRSAEHDDAQDPTGLLYGEFGWNNAGEKLFIGQKKDSNATPTIAKFHLSTTLDITAGTSLTGVLAANDGTDNGLTLNVDAASATAAGAIELAIETEVEGGTDTTRAVTAATLKKWAEDNTVAIVAGKLPTLDNITGPGDSLAMGGEKITGLGTPTLSSDAATKAYVDASKAGLDVKDSVRAAAEISISNVLIAYSSSLYVIDGVTTALDDRVLLKCQEGAADHTANAVNGIYTVKATTAPSGYQLVRALDFDENVEVTAGAFTFIEEGTVNSDSGWVLTTDDAITVGTTDIAFTQFSGAGQIVAGAGIKKTANTLSVLLHSSGGVDYLAQAGTDKLAVDLSATNIQGTLADGKIASATTWNGKQDALSFGAVADSGTVIPTGNDVYDFVIGLGYSTTTGDVTLAGTQTLTNKTIDCGTWAAVS